MSQSGAERLLHRPLLRDWIHLGRVRARPGIDAEPAQGRGGPSAREVETGREIMAPHAPSRASFILYTADCHTLLKDAGRTPRLIVTPNLDHLRMLDRSQAFRRAYAAADVVLNDSRFLDLLALNGAALCMPGSDLAPDMLNRLAPGAGVLVIGAEPAVQDYLMTTHAELSLGFIQPSVGYVRSARERKAIVSQVLAARPDVVFICTGAPQSELLGAQLKRAGCGADILCCGGALQILARVKRRAPRPFRRLGAEWVWRFVTEPHTRERYAADSLFLMRELGRFLELRRTGAGRFRRFDLRTRS